MSARKYLDAVHDEVAGDEAGASARRAAATDLVPPAFRRELMPTWLSATAVLAGQRPPELDRPLRVLDLRCGRGLNAAVIAAAHPEAEVWAGDDDPANTEHADGLARAAGLGNLTVIEPGASTQAGHSSLPPSVDIALVDDMVSTTDDAGRAAIAAVIDGHVRAGGLIAVTYRTRVVWSEVLPVRVLARLLFSTQDRATSWEIAAFVAMVEQLRSAGARYLVDRPTVVALVEALATMDRDELDRVLLTEHLEPMGFVDVADWLASSGAAFVGSGRLGADLRLGSESPLLDLLDDTHDLSLREALGDLATRPSFRVDVFRRGAARLSADARRSLLTNMELVAVDESADLLDEVITEQPALADAVGRAVERLGEGPASLGELVARCSPDPVRTEHLARVLLDRGLAHPRSVGWGADITARDTCRRLNERLSEAGVAWCERWLVSPVIGSAVPADRSTLSTQLGTSAVSDVT